MKHFVWDVYVTRDSLSKSNRAAGDHATPGYKNRVRATNRAEAVMKCAPEIWPLVGSDISVVAVYCGKFRNKTEAASRLDPIRIRRAK